MTSLAELDEHGSCLLCDLSFGLDLDESVELVFSPAQAVRVVDKGPDCFGGPARTPHVLAQTVLPAGGSGELETPSVPGVAPTFTPTLNPGFRRARRGRHSLGDPCFLSMKLGLRRTMFALVLAPLLGATLFAVLQVRQLSRQAAELGRMADVIDVAVDVVRFNILLGMEYSDSWNMYNSADAGAVKRRGCAATGSRSRRRSRSPRSRAAGWWWSSATSPSARTQRSRSSTSPTTMH
jgi:hypothetical protein